MSLSMTKRSFTLARFLRYSSTKSTEAISETVNQKSSVDNKEIEHHEKLSEQWWNKQGQMRALHAFNPLRVQFIRDGFKNVGWTESNPRYPLEGLEILDVGCGGGILSEALARAGANVTGIDASKQLIETAKKHASLDSNLSKNLIYIDTSVEDHVNNQAKIYDGVVASEVLEHVSNKDIFINYCTKALKPGGSIFITTLNQTIPSFIGGIIFAEYLLNIVPIGTHEWNKFISPENTRCLLERYGCTTKLIHGMIYNPLTNKWHWTSSEAINYAIHAIKSDD
ncbi:ubiquinone biosynthesis O-methyltransferase, mitochondrial [Microplitis demolitor]|uniref:ubiquinone biosynthesis O-methyltransferase, mitochondrial n=1 Tax=Microplitis demolitor TaxID=69319 RepID=UPI00043FFE3D|nr:ubiquinone biosynthesis O-methyltransferase, mitochondrial [Microplitis demolitor]XP_008546141.1 ubiquinone biosynthesis O-methyltransferase, mitochondrial [Microplitis demolitor]